MKLQLAVDATDLSEAMRLVDEVADLIDIVEVGTPLALRHGAGTIAQIAERHSHLEVLADFKIMDAGSLEARIAFDAGAHIVTVLGVANDATIAGAVAQARKRGCRVMADLIAAHDIVTRAAEVTALGVDYLCVHTAYDVQSEGVDPLHDVRLVQPMAGSAALAVAGGVQPDTVTELLPFQPAIIVVGGFIANHESPRQAAQAIRSRMSKLENQETP